MDPQTFFRLSVVNYYRHRVTKTCLLWYFSAFLEGISQLQRDEKLIWLKYLSDGFCFQCVLEVFSLCFARPGKFLLDFHSISMMKLLLRKKTFEWVKEEPGGDFWTRLNAVLLSFDEKSIEFRWSMVMSLPSVHRNKRPRYWWRRAICTN